jgi:Tfp pilus assembly protein PilN
MIKINLLPQRKVRRRQSEPGQRDVLLGFLLILVAGAAVFMFLHKPAMDELADLEERNGSRQRALAGRKKEIAKLTEFRAAEKEVTDRAQLIQKLVDSRAVPAHLLQELADILTTGREPTMTAETTLKRASLDPAYAYRTDWDPKNTWITEFVENKGLFTLTGGAASVEDVDQLAKRMQSSEFFEEVTPGHELITDKEGKLPPYYEFTIKGKVVY